MAREITLEEIQEKAESALRDRMGAIRSLIELRAQIHETETKLSALKTTQASTFDAALKAGWAAAELKSFGLTADAAPARKRAPRAPKPERSI